MPQVTAIHPETGEIVTVTFTGNFPMKDPQTNHLILEQKEDRTVGPKFPGRARARYQVLNQNGEEVLDTRPMAAAVMFSDHIPPEQKIAEMMRDANFRAQLRAYLAEEQGVDTFDEFDYDDDLLPSNADGLISPHELVADPKIQKHVPRYLVGMFNNVKKAVQKGSGPLAPSPTSSNNSSPEASETAKGDASTGGD